METETGDDGQPPHHHSAASSSSYFFTQPSAPHSRKIAMAVR